MEKVNASIIHSIQFVNDAFGECVKMWCTKEQESEGLLYIISSVTRNVVIRTTFETCTLIHMEDALLNTFNLLVLDAPKILYVISKYKFEELTKCLKKQKWFKHVYYKQCHIDCFSNDTKALLS